MNLVIAYTIGSISPTLLAILMLAGLLCWCIMGWLKYWELRRLWYSVQDALKEPKLDVRALYRDYWSKGERVDIKALKRELDI